MHHLYPRLLSHTSVGCCFWGTTKTPLQCPHVRIIPPWVSNKCIFEVDDRMLSAVMRTSACRSSRHHARRRDIRTSDGTLPALPEVFLQVAPGTRVARRPVDRRVRQGLLPLIRGLGLLRLLPVLVLRLGAEDSVREGAESPVYGVGDIVPEAHGCYPDRLL